MAEVGVNKRKKVLFVITKSDWGGAQQYVFDLATNLPLSRFDVVVVAGGDGLLAEKLEAAKIRTIMVSSLRRDVNAIKEIASVYYLWRIFLKEKPDIIHLNSSKAGGLGAIAAFLYKVRLFNFSPRVIFTVHGWGFKEVRPLPQKILIFFACLIASFFQDRIITISKSDFNSARNIIPSAKLRLIHNGVNPPAYLPRDKARLLLEKNMSIPLEADAIAIGAIAELTANKGLGYLIDAISLLEKSTPKKIQLVVIGEGEERSRLEKKIREMKHENIFLAGFVPDAKRYIRAFDIIALPSIKEGLPYALLEAMGAGVPVIASKVGGIPDVIEDGRNGLLVAPKDTAGLAAALETLAENPDLRKSISRLSSEKIRNKFPLDGMINETLKVYQS